MDSNELKTLKESIDTLIDENERLRNKIKILEGEDSDATNVFERQVEKTLEKLLREYKTNGCGYDSYLEDGSDLTYRPRRGTDRHYYPPYIPEVGDWPPGPQVGDWPPGPQVGDVPPGTIPPGYPYWSIYPPYWPYNWFYRNNASTTGGKLNNCGHTVSESKENEDGDL